MVVDFLKIDHKNTPYRNLNKIFGLDYVGTRLYEETHYIEDESDIGSNTLNVYNQIFGKDNINKRVNIKRYDTISSTVFNMKTKTDKEQTIFAYLCRLLPMIPTFINNIMIPVKQDIDDRSTRYGATDGLEFENSLSSIEVFVEKCDRIYSTRSGYDIYLEYEFVKEKYMKSIGIVPNFVSSDMARIGFINLINGYVDNNVFETAVNHAEDIISHILTEFVGTIICTNFTNIYNAFNDDKVDAKDFEFNNIDIKWNNYTNGVISFNIGLHTNKSLNFNWIDQNDFINKPNINKLFVTED